MMFSVEDGLVQPLDKEGHEKLETVAHDICEKLYEEERIVSLGAVQHCLGYVWCQRAGSFTLDDMINKWREYSAAVEVLIKAHAEGKVNPEENSATQ